MEWLFWRCCSFVGVCVEFVAAVAWLAELFSDPAQRVRVIGYTQAFGSFGGVMVAGAYYLAVTYGHFLPEIRGGHEAWRYTLMSGVIPAIPLIIIRPFLPESPAWQEKKRAGTLRRPSFAALFTPEFRRTTIVTTIAMAAVRYRSVHSADAAIVPGLEQVRRRARPRADSHHAVLEVGGLADARCRRIRCGHHHAAAAGAVKPASCCWIVFLLVPMAAPSQWGIFIVGLTTIAQMSFWETTCRAYPTHLRGTGKALLPTWVAAISARLLPSSLTVNIMPGPLSRFGFPYACACRHRVA